MSKIIPSEKAEQSALVAYLRKKEGLYYIHSIENSFHFPLAEFPKNIKHQIISLLSRLKNQRLAMGQVEGMPDLFIPSLNLYIEMKKKEGGVVSYEQKKCHEGLRGQGYYVMVAYGFKHALELIEYFKELKENEDKLNQ